MGSAALLLNASSKLFPNVRPELTYYPPTWDAGVSAVLQSIRAGNSSRAIVCGAKGVGKSTCLRYLVNRLLCKGGAKAVCVIDCDVGQPELGPPGLISLHIVKSPILSPCHLNQQRPHLSYFIGDITTKNEPETLIRLLRELYKRYTEIRDEYLQSGELPNDHTSPGTVSHSAIRASNPFGVLCTPTLHPLPLVVNTDGNVRYIGAEILAAVVSIVNPHHVLHLSTEKDRHLPALDQATIDGNAPSVIHTLEPGSYVPSGVASVELRILRMVAYFLRRDASLKDKVRRISFGVNSNTKGGNQGVDEVEDEEEGDVGDSKDVEKVDGNKMCVQEEALIKDDVVDMNGEESDGAMHNTNTINHHGCYIRNGTVVDRSGVIANALMASQAYRVPFDIVSLRMTTAGVPPRLILAAFNASIVGITEGKGKGGGGNGIDGGNGGNGHVLLEHGSTVFSLDCDGVFDPTARCFGLGIVRAVEVATKSLLIITPSPPSQASSSSDTPLRIRDSKTACLVLGDLGLPQLFVYGLNLPCYPYMSGECAGEGSLVMKARTNVKRRNQIHN